MLLPEDSRVKIQRATRRVIITHTIKQSLTLRSTTQVFLNKNAKLRKGVKGRFKEVANKTQLKGSDKTG